MQDILLAKPYSLLGPPPIKSNQIPRTQNETKLDEIEYTKHQNVEGANYPDLHLPKLQAENSNCPL